LYATAGGVRAGEGGFLRDGRAQLRHYLRSAGRTARRDIIIINIILYYILYIIYYIIIINFY